MQCLGQYVYTIIDGRQGSNVSIIHMHIISAVILLNMHFCASLNFVVVVLSQGPAFIQGCVHIGSTHFLLCMKLCKHMDSM